MRKAFAILLLVLVLGGQQRPVDAGHFNGFAPTDPYHHPTNVLIAQANHTDLSVFGAHGRGAGQPPVDSLSMDVNGLTTVGTPIANWLQVAASTLTTRRGLMAVCMAGRGCNRGTLDANSYAAQIFDHPGMQTVEELLVTPALFHGEMREDGSLQMGTYALFRRRGGRWVSDRTDELELYSVTRTAAPVRLDHFAVGGQVVIDNRGMPDMLEVGPNGVRPRRRFSQAFLHMMAAHDPTTTESKTYQHSWARRQTILQRRGQRPASNH